MILEKDIAEAAKLIERIATLRKWLTYTLSDTDHASLRLRIPPTITSQGQTFDAPLSVHIRQMAYREWRKGIDASLADCRRRAAQLNIKLAEPV